MSQGRGEYSANLDMNYFSQINNYRILSLRNLLLRYLFVMMGSVGPFWLTGFRLATFSGMTYQGDHIVFVKLKALISVPINNLLFIGVPLV